MVATALLAALAAVLAAYGLVVRSLGSGSRFYRTWLALAALAAAAAVAHGSGAWGLLPQAARVALPAVALAFAAWVACLSFAIMRASKAPAPDDLDVLVVLGAQVMPDGSPCLALAARLDAARAYLDAHPGCRCVVSGGRGPNEPVSEAESMAAYLEARGVDAARVALEDRSRSTVENLRFSRRLLAPGEERVGVVTNDFHLRRALAVARREQIREPRGVSAPSDRLYLPNYLLRECLCSALYLLRGHGRQAGAQARE